ncbi:glycosyltransferase family 2 protein [Salinicola avicenniae]|uniref:glycosyltransferase family 2 protein n=1 Tax=Salinicola avicenniae TaxID=2916836 RepID=UPI002072B571|nr:MULTISPECIES: glycosyltransferase [unclassified Salinicola]
MLALPKLSIVLIVSDRHHRVPAVIDEASRALPHAETLDIVIIDDATETANGQRLHALAAADPRVRLYRQPTPIGDDAALRQAVALVNGEWVARLDAYGRDDPHDLPDMLCEARQYGLTLVQGVPLDPRCRWRASLLRVARRFGLESRRSGTYGMRLIRRDVLATLPAVNRVQHFLPMLIRRTGGRVGTLYVNRRPSRQAPRPALRQLPLQLLRDTLDGLGMWWLTKRWHADKPSLKRRQRGYVRG